MTAVIDAAPVVAAADARDPRRSHVERALRDEPGVLILPQPVAAEVDYLLGRRLGQRSRRLFLSDLAAGRFLCAGLEREDLMHVAELDRRYEGLSLGLADLSVIVLARRFSTTRVVTFDERHFRAVRPLRGDSFTLLPGDEL